MKNTNKVSQSIQGLTPQFIVDEYPLFSKFVEYYYKSQEKVGLGQNIVNDLLSYLNIDDLQTNILDGETILTNGIGSGDSTIYVENVDNFLDTDGTVLIDSEVIFYEKTVASPSIALSPGVSFEQVQFKWKIITPILDQFDGVKRSFKLLSQNTPVVPPSAQHLIIKNYNQILIPGVDYTIDGDNVVFAVAPRQKTASDDATESSITFFSGFVDNQIVVLDNISGSFGDNKVSFVTTRNGVSYRPIVDEYVYAIYNNQLLIPKKDFTFDGDLITFNFVPLAGRSLALFSIEAPIPDFGSGCIGFSRVSDTGELTDIVVSNNGSNYRFEYPPKVTILGDGRGASAKPLVNGIKNIKLLDGGRGYSDSNPPSVIIESPTKPDGTVAVIKPTVVDGVITNITLENSGSGYTFVPRISFRQPGGAQLGPVTISDGRVVGSIQVIDGGFGYTTPPSVYIDPPTGDNGISAVITTTLDTNGQVVSATIVNSGFGYENQPRIAVIDPVGAQVLECQVDGSGRVINIDLLDGGVGYEDIPSVYIVDDRVDNRGVYIGGSGATAVASIFNGQVTDINIVSFGSGYSADFPPKVIIQPPASAKASAEIGLGEITGFEVISRGSEYKRCRLEGCARAASGITGYTEDGNVILSGETIATSHSSGAKVSCLDSAFVKRVLDKYLEQYLPDIPQLDYKSIDVKTAIKNIKTFYSTKGTSFSVSYLFKLLYGEDVSVTYPKDQIIKPSDSIWSVNTILRATLVSGDPENIKDGLLQQFEDIADPEIKNASALVENFIAIKTSDFDIYELVLSDETIVGNFVVPYKTKLAENLSIDTNIITVDSTIGWPERNGEIVIGGSEVIRYKEKSLNQFIECTRGINSTIAQNWDAASEVTSNFKVYINRGSDNEVVLNILGIVDAEQTVLTDSGNYYLPGDKLTVSKLGGSLDTPLLTSWLYNVKKLVEVDSITYGGVNDQYATVTCKSPHGLLVGDQVTVYGANPIIYNGSFLVTSRDSEVTFQYKLPQPAVVDPQGNILISVDLNLGKSQNSAIANAIGPYTTNVQNSFFNDEYVYVASTGIPNYNIGPFLGSALLPGNQRKLNRFKFTPTTISSKTEIAPGPVGTFVNGVSVWSYKSTNKKTFGGITSISITNPGKDYDAASPPKLTISNGGGSGASANVTVNGSITEIEVIAGGSGYTSSPLVSIVGGGGSGASATAIITKGSVSKILINNGGSGYTSKPEITIVGGGGSGATASASVRGPIGKVTITDNGSGYTSNPDISLSSGGGALAQAIVQNGRIISIAIINAGSGYTTAPAVSIQGDGFGAVAKATIDVDGENAGRVTNITILNRGIGYSSGTTIIILTEVGQDATFEPNVFEWTYNVQQITSFDAAKGSVFEGLNTQYGAEYAHASNPQRLRYALGDNLIENEFGLILEANQQLKHSPIIGWAFDGNPIYGPYGYEDPTDQTSQIIRMQSSWSIKPELIYDQLSNPYPSRQDGPSLNTDPAGNFVEDYIYNFGQGDLDQYNGRFCKTPEFPEGRYCYFVTIDQTEEGNPVFPYILGPSYNSVVDSWNLVNTAVQQNIPRGVIRYRDPYESVDIDVERVPNASTNQIITEDGDLLLFDIEDENLDGIISQDETDDPEGILEESPLELFDYFPKVRFDSKVDIEVETISKFEDASVTGFEIENPGNNYQVNDILVFDNTGTDGNGVSARISTILGNTVTNYTYESIQNVNYGIITTDSPHNLIVGDTIFVDYTPVMDNTNKTFVVRQYSGIEEVVVDQVGSGYNTDIPPVVIIDGDGDSGKIEAILNDNGSIDKFKIINSGYNYTNNPRVIITHPQIFKKTQYFVSLFEQNNFVKINDIHVNTDKSFYICGNTLDDVGNTVGFVSKVSSSGVIEWQKSLESTLPSLSITNTQFNKLLVDGKNIWVVGTNRPNSAILNNYNPDIIIAKYVESIDGLSASLSFQKAYSGISGATRSDIITCIKKLSDTRIIIGGYTDTNSVVAMDAFVAVLDNNGVFVSKRKIASSSKSEKLLDILVTDSGVYFLAETSANSTATSIGVAFGKISVYTSSIEVDWIKELTNSAYSFLDSSICVDDEFNEFYITSTTRLKSDNVSSNGFVIAKLDTTGALIWNYRYLAPIGQIRMAPSSNVDIFGDINVAYTESNIINSQKKLGSIKLNYKGEILNHNQTVLNPTESTVTNNIEGLTVNTLRTDVSGDTFLFGQTSWNRNEFILKFTDINDFSDSTEHYTVDTLGNDITESLVVSGDGIAKFFGRDIATPANWENAVISINSDSILDRLGGDWTLEFMLYKDSTNTQTHSQTQQTLFAIGDATDSTGGLWMYYDMTSGRLELVVTNNVTSINSASSALQSTSTTMYANNTWQFIGLKKSGDIFTAYVNGIQVFTGSISNTALENKTLYIGNIPGRNGVAGIFRSNEQGQYYLDNIRLRNRAVTPTVPSDVSALPSVGGFGLAYDWVDDSWFTTNLNQYDYVDYIGFGYKVDKTQDSVRLGNFNTQTNTEIDFTRSAITPAVGSALTISNVGYSIGEIGLQTLDFLTATTTLLQNTVTLTTELDNWSSRNATIPTPGSQKVKATAVTKDRYYFKLTDTTKIDNVQVLTLNQNFNITIGSKLVLNNPGFVNSGYVIDVDRSNRKVYVAINNNDWSNDLNIGNLSTERFEEQTTYGITGPFVNDTNQIFGYQFEEVLNTTPGVFDIDLANYDAPFDVGGTNNLNQYALFQAIDSGLYQARIIETGGASQYIPGSVVELTNNNVSFNSTYSTLQITGLTAVTKITLTCNLQKILQVTATTNTDTVYVITSGKHYLSAGQQIFIDGNPSQQVGQIVYDEYDGAFPVETVISDREFTYKLDNVALTTPSTNPSSVDVFVKSPNIKMYYGHQYIFDMSHSSLLGGNLSFSKDGLYKLEYSFNSIERGGVPGISIQGQPAPYVKLKVDRDIVTNISYYFDPSRSDDESTPITPGSFLDIVDSPYVGQFTISGVSGGTITTGATIMRFPLINEPEGDAYADNASYTTSSTKAVGPIGGIRIVNKGGFYTKLPVITDIISNRKIERVQINDPGTEYAVGEYNNVPIGGDGEGGTVTIRVENTTDEEGNTIPGQIVEVVVTSSGKGYTTAFIDIDSIDGILGSGLAGSGADLEVVIPPFGSGASIFAKATSVGKIRKLKNNNFGYDYTHDYTLRPEITFPVNAQLTNTSILSSITVTDPGSGYSQPPAVIISGGGGSGAIAEATVKNGRIDQIIIKDSGAGYSSTPTVSLRSSFNYTINLDLGLLQFAFPHGIQSGSPVLLSVVDTGSGAELPIAAGAIGRLSTTTTYYAIAGVANSLEDDQLKLAITPANAELGDGISFVNPGTGRQQILTESFGGAAEANVTTSDFLEGELVYQGSSVDNATAIGYVSTNSGWQVGPRIIKIVNYEGDFIVGESITGVISKSSGIISSLNNAKGVLEIGSITKTSGQFIDDVGKTSEIVQRIQDSYYYQDFSYAINSSVTISDWRDTVIKNVHPASFKVFGQLGVSEDATISNRETDFQLVKSVELSREAIVPNIQNFALAEPIYTEFDNTQVLFRQKRLTSSENILTSVVQKLDDISQLFDGERITFPLTTDGSSVIANQNQLLIIINGVVQTPGTSFTVQDDSLVFSDPPQPPASVKYVTVGIEQIPTKSFTFSSVSGIFPEIGNSLFGTDSGARAIVTKVEGNTIFGYIDNNIQFIDDELCSVNATGFNGILETQSDISNLGLFIFGETVRDLQGDTAKVEQVNLAAGQETPLAKLRYGVGLSTTQIEVIPSSGPEAPLPENTFRIGGEYRLGAEIFEVTNIVDNLDSTTLTVIRARLNTVATAQLANVPLYSTEITLSDTIVLSKTVGTYQSTPGLYDIQSGDVIVAAGSGVVARITSTAIYQNPTDNETIGDIVISEGSSFSGFLFNRIQATTYPNVVIDDISLSQVSIVDYYDNTTAFDSRFPSTEFINNYIIKTVNETGSLEDGEYVRNNKIEYSNNTGDFIIGEIAEVRKLSLRNREGSGFFSPGQIIRSKTSKAEVVGYNQPRGILYLGKSGRSTGTGADVHSVVFNGGAKLSTTQKKFGLTSLYLDGDGDYLNITNSTEFDFNDYTLEAWIYLPSLPAEAYSMIFATTGANQYWGIRNVSGTLYLTSFTNGIINEQTTGSGVNTSQWTHVAWSRNGGTIRSFINGNLVHTGTSVGISDVSGLNIGYSQSYVNQYEFNGYIDEVRVSANVSRYNAQFTAPTGVFQGDANTKLLLHFDGENNQTYIQDWSGEASWVNGDQFANDSILATYVANSGSPVVGFVGKTFRYLDAANLLLANKEFIARELVYQLENSSPYAPFSVPTGSQSCIDDVIDVVEQLAFDLRNGSNSYIWDAAAIYVDRTQNPIQLNYIETEIDETLWVYNELITFAQSVINNQFITVTGDHGLTQVTNASLTDSNTAVLTTLTPTNASYDPATGDFVITVAGHGLTTNDIITLAQESFTFTCPSDGNQREISHPRITDPAYNAVLQITATTTDTFTVNVGASPIDQQYPHTFVSADANSVTVLDYSSADCADVKDTIDNLLTILVDTLDQANQPTPVDHLASITRVSPEYQYLGAYVDGYYTIPFNVTNTDQVNDIIYSDRIDTTDRNRFYDAANLIRLNKAAIIDKTAYDLIDRYPLLALTMPRNGDGSGAGTLRCKTDLGLILDALVLDIENGGNANTITAIKAYLGVNDAIQHIRLQLLQSLYAHTRLGYYMKQAVTGDLDETNTDNEIFGDWGITNDPGGCANVKTAIDTLIDLANDILAPTGNRFRDAGDLLYFNKGYISDESVSLLDAEFSYVLNGVTYQSFTYPSGGRSRCQVDIQLILDSIITDLLTGGNYNSVEAAEYYLNSNGGIIFVEDQLAATLYAFEQTKNLGRKAINNLLYTKGDAVTGDQYAAVYTDQVAYRDNTITDSNGDGQYTSTDCADVIAAYETLWDLIIDTLSPARDTGIYASRTILNNKNYYIEEIGQTVTEQFGSGSWTYSNFLTTVVDDIVHDVILTDTSANNTTTATPISLLREGVIGTITFTGGSGYQSVPIITIDPPASGGVQATATAILSDGSVLTGFDITSGGSGYLYAPTFEFAGTGLPTGLGGSTTITAGVVTESRYDGYVIDYRSSNSLDFILGPGCAFRSNGTGTNSSNGFNAGNSYVLFGAGAGTANVSTNAGYDTIDTDTVRVYAIAGSSSNGGETPDTDENLELWYSTNGGATWTLHDVIIYGGSNGTSGINGQNQNRSNFVNINYVDIPLKVGAKSVSTRFRVQRTIGTAGSTIDNYGLYRIGLIDNAQEFPIDATLIYESAEAETGGNEVEPTITITTSISVVGINITNRGKGYDPNNPPSASFSGGDPIVAATITNVTAILDQSRFVSGVTVTSSGGGSATVLQDTGDTLYVGPVTGNPFAQGDTLTQGSITSEIPANGVGSEFDWYTNVANVQTFATARSITSLVESESFSTNLFSNPETYTTAGIAWVSSSNTVTNNIEFAPDGTFTAIRVRPNTTNNTHYIYRDYILTSYETLDASNVRFDSGAYRFDSGPISGDSTQKYTISYFIKGAEYSKFRIQYRLNTGSTPVLTMDVDTASGSVVGFFNSYSSVFSDVDYGMIPYGNGWYRVYITASIGYGFSRIRSYIDPFNAAGTSLTFAGNSVNQYYIWGAKINAGGLDAYVSQSGVNLYVNTEYNIKTYALDLLETFIESALLGNLTSPSTNAGFFAYTNTTWQTYYNPYSFARIARVNLDLIRNQILDSEYYTTVDLISGVSYSTKTYGNRNIPIPLGGGITFSDNFYALSSNNYAEIQSIIKNQAKVVKQYQRFRIDDDIVDGPFVMNETVEKQGDATTTGVVYGFVTDENFKYIDIEVTNGTWSLADVIVGSTNGSTAQISAIENRLQITSLVGDFDDQTTLLGYSSDATVDIIEFMKNEAAVISNVGGKLTVDTETLVGNFEKTAVVFPETSEAYIDVYQYDGLDIEVGDRIVSAGNIRLGISILQNLNTFTVGNYVFKLTNGVKDNLNYALVTSVDLDNNRIYITPILGNISNSDTIVSYDPTGVTVVGRASVNTKVTTAGAGGALVQDIRPIGLNLRLYLSDIVGNINSIDTVKSSSFRAYIIDYVDLRGRVKRSFRGFDGVQTTFNLTVNNGDQYFPDPEGHMLIFINGILQPPGASNSFTAFSDKIQFTEAPTLGSAFVGIYLGKMRQLDDISFDFDSLRQSFNLKRNGTFYSLTLTDGVQTTGSINPENNIIVSVNGVIQEPGVGFELVGSRIIFSEIPRVGSTFVAFSYVGSEADVDAAEVVPPIESGDLIQIEGEISDRQVAVIESSNSLTTFDYLGSVFGSGAVAQANITTGQITDVAITSPGSGYTARPNVRVDSISGFDAQIKALVGVGGVVVSNPGSGYKIPEVLVETEVPDDWTPPNLADYGEEVIDPEILSPVN